MNGIHVRCGFDIREKKQTSICWTVHLLLICRLECLPTYCICGRHWHSSCTGRHGQQRAPHPRTAISVLRCCHQRNTEWLVAHPGQHTIPRYRLWPCSQHNVLLCCCRYFCILAIEDEEHRLSRTKPTRTGPGPIHGEFFRDGRTEHRCCDADGELNRRPGGQREFNQATVKHDIRGLCRIKRKNNRGARQLELMTAWTWR